MVAVTTRHSQKPFAWSYSKLKNFETCPKRHQQIDILKRFQEESEQLAWGGRVHTAAAKRLGSPGIPLPKEMEAMLEPWCQKIEQYGGKIYVEQKLAIKEDFSPCGYFDRGVWFRTVADVIQVRGDVALGVDWKTGKIIEDSVQLALLAQCIFSHHQDVRAIRTEFIWLKEDATTTEIFRRRDMPQLWKELAPRIAELRRAYETEVFPPHHNKLCRQWCPVTTCEFHGVSTYD